MWWHVKVFPPSPGPQQIADDYIVFSNTIINACETISHTQHHLAHTIKVFFCGNLAFVLWSAKWQLFNTVKKNTIGMFTALFGALKPPGNCFLNHKFTHSKKEFNSSCQLCYNWQLELCCQKWTNIYYTTSDAAVIIVSSEHFDSGIHIDAVNASCLSRNWRFIDRWGWTVFCCPWTVEVLWHEQTHSVTIYSDVSGPKFHIVSKAYHFLLFS